MDGASKPRGGRARAAGKAARHNIDRCDPIWDSMTPMIGTLWLAGRLTAMDVRSHHTARAGKGFSAGVGQRDLDALGWDFRRVYPVDEAPCFGELLRKIDAANA